MKLPTFLFIAALVLVTFGSGLEEEEPDKMSDETFQPPTDSSFGNTDWHSRHTLSVLTLPPTHTYTHTWTLTYTICHKDKEVRGDVKKRIMVPLVIP